MGFFGNWGRAIRQQAAQGSAYRGLDQAPARARVSVKTYASESDLERDAEKMLAAGWTVEGQSSKAGGVAVGRTLGKAALTGGVGLLLTGRSKKGDKITVTWVRD